MFYTHQFLLLLHFLHMIWIFFQDASGCRNLLRDLHFTPHTNFSLKCPYVAYYYHLFRHCRNNILIFCCTSFCGRIITPRYFLRCHSEVRNQTISWECSGFLKNSVANGLRAEPGGWRMTRVTLDHGIVRQLYSQLASSWFNSSSLRFTAFFFI